MGETMSALSALQGVVIALNNIRNEAVWWTKEYPTHGPPPMAMIEGVIEEAGRALAAISPGFKTGADDLNSYEESIDPKGGVTR